MRFKKCMETPDRPPELLFKKSMEERSAPKEWKRPNIVTISTKGDRINVLNYRSVPLMSMVCKMLKKDVQKQVDDYLQKRIYQSEMQHGYR